MQITVIGCGNMGQALAKRLSPAHQLFFYDHNPEKAKALESQGCGTACQNISEALHSEITILAIKPQNLKAAAESIRLKNNQILVSLLAGTTLQMLQKYFPSVKIIRMMPNLPLLYGEGAIGLSSNDENEDKAYWKKLFEPLGKLYWLKEDKFDALTALAGSGPAFLFCMIEAMIDAGIAMGLSIQEAKDLTCQMIKGSLTLLEQTGKHPGELKWQITSPQGTTIAGLKRLEEHAVRGGIINTFLAAYNRSKEL